MSRRTELPREAIATPREAIATMHEDIWTDSRWRSRVRSRLLDWFATHARDLPWRKTTDPYLVWISEVMLQQTQVATVIPYYERFVEQFPTVLDLASADERRLLKLWEGLGYYRRARSMHQAAKRIVDEYDGAFPTDLDRVIKLPGIGRYTAGAILSICTGARLPILEGNTVRVFSRWVALQTPTTHPESNRLLWQISEAMLPRKPGNGNLCGAFNQAAMELGALVCTPKNPQCEQCPVKSCCRAYRSGLQTAIPGRVKDIAYENRTEFALVVPKKRDAKARRGGDAKFLIRPLPVGGRWAGLWDFPRTCEQSCESIQTAADVLGDSMGRKFSPGVRLKTIRHAVTKYRITLHVHAATMTQPSRQLPRPWRFVSLREMSELPMSVTGRKITDFLLAKDDGSTSAAE